MAKHQKSTNKHVHHNTSKISWIDHDYEARERSLRILSFFQAKESRDELGLGSIRDSIAEQLFPGTSTTHTRLRYMLFVPWIYMKLEQDGVRSNNFSDLAIEMERDLIEFTISSNPGESGIFGRDSGRNLKRLPSSAYWSSLGTWKIRKMDLSQYQYHRQIDSFYNWRKEQKELLKERTKNSDDDEPILGSQTDTWDPNLPASPNDFPQIAKIDLTVEEAQYLLDRIPNSLFADLARDFKPSNVDEPWYHPELAKFKKEHQDLLEIARIFSSVMYGAALIYNMALAKIEGWSIQKIENTYNFEEWLEGIQISDINGSYLGQLWNLTQVSNPKTRNFVKSWVDLVVRLKTNFNKKIVGDAMDLVKEREIYLKNGQSRFKNSRAREQWGQASALRPLNFRWPYAKTFLKDLQNGLRS